MTHSAAAEFTALVTPHMPRLSRLGMRLTRQPSEASDLVQEALCRAWTNRSRFEAGGSIGAYLARIVVNTFISGHRHARVVDAAAARCDLVEHLFDGGRIEQAQAPEGSWHASLLSDEILDALDALPTHYREVVDLVDLDGHPYKEAADRLGIPLGTVMSRLHRARRILRERLTGYAQTMGMA